MDDVVVIEGRLGWANGDRSPIHSPQLDAYGPGGRWHAKLTPSGETHGHHLADALVEAGCGEGAVLIVVAVDRGPEQAERLQRVREALGRGTAPNPATR